MKKETWITIGICSIFLVIAGILYLNAGVKKNETGQKQWITDGDYSSSEAKMGDSVEASDASKQENGSCTVYICGAVKKPGVYSFPEGARVCDAVEAAGGLKKKALPDAVNQARVLIDGEQITIPSKSNKQTTTSSETGEMVNINQATAEELMTLSGIGEAKAQMIIAYREENGFFSSKEDIMKISGIKEGVYNQIKDDITV